jgi:ribosomal protein L16 Arg81 hydroxylase
MLPFSSSPDLPREMIGKPVLEVTLTPGDVLYLPRGFVHEAVAQDSSSSHITVSTYQHHTQLNLAQRVLAMSLEVRVCASGTGTSMQATDA